MSKDNSIATKRAYKIKKKAVITGVFDLSITLDL